FREAVTAQFGNRVQMGPFASEESDSIHDGAIRSRLCRPRLACAKSRSARRVRAFDIPPPGHTDNYEQCLACTRRRSVPGTRILFLAAEEDRPRVGRISG